MISRIPKSLWIFLSFVVALVLYWPSMHGRPVWDDLSFFFQFDAIIRPGSYLTIIKEFGWPLSVIAHKWLYTLWHTEYFNYHLLNLGLHFLNSYLLLKVAEKMKLPFAFGLFLLFLFHPANVISVSWMIQFKTLLCFTFAIIAFYFLTKAQANRKWIMLSWSFFALSLLSKSASLPLPAVFFLFLYPRVSRKELLWTIPFFLMSLAGTYRLLNSPVTISSIKNLESKPLTKKEERPQPISAENATQKVLSKVELKPQAPAPVAKVEVPPPPVFTDGVRLPEKPIKPSIFLSTLHYYFWQTLLPVETQPVRGLKYSGPGVLECVHLFFLLMIVILNWRKSLLFYLLSGHLMLLPFLGILPAPYMNVTWVSDQHLYLALPMFLCFWLLLLNEAKRNWTKFIPYGFLPLFFFLIARSTPYYKDEITFYKASLEADMLNVPISYNLAVAYVYEGRLKEAYDVTDLMVHLSTYSPEVRWSPYYTHLFILNISLQNKLDEKK